MWMGVSDGAGGHAARPRTCSSRCWRRRASRWPAAVAASNGGSPASSARAPSLRHRPSSGSAAAVPSRPPAPESSPHRRPRRQPDGGLRAAEPRTSRSRPCCSRRWTRRSLPYEVVNMGVSGDTTAGGLRRLDWALDGDVRVLVVALGGNDGLRGLGPAQMRENLSAHRRRRGAQGRAACCCAAWKRRRTWAPTTRAQFRAVYGELARDKQVAFLPVPARRRGRPARAQPARRHPSQRGRCATRGRRSSGAQLRPMLTATSTS